MTVSDIMLSALAIVFNQNNESEREKLEKSLGEED